jgi:hypothetical protein
MRPVRNTAPATWLPADRARFFSVGWLVPPGFERYLFVDDPDELLEPWWDALQAHTAAIASALAAHTSTPDEIYVGVWEGHGYDLTREQAAELRQFDLEGRRYHLLGGPLSGIPELMTPNVPITTWQQPDLWWPADHAWFVATDIDIWCCYVGGTADAIDAVIAAVGTSIHPVERTDPLENVD